MTTKRRGRNDGSISPRTNGTWRAQVSINGRRISYGAQTKIECQQWIRKTLHTADERVESKDPTITVSEFMANWLDTARISLRPKTTLNYAWIIRQKINPLIGNLKLTDLNLIRVERFYTDLLNKGNGPRLVRHTHAVLHRALERAVRYDLLYKNPTHGATLPRYSPPEMKVLDEAQVNQFLMSARSSPYIALYHLAIVTGMRQGEIYGLTWDDLHWHTGELQVRRQAVSTSGGGWNFSEPKTRFGTRIIKLGESTLRVLQAHKDRQQSQIFLAGSRWQKNNLIFPSAAGTPLNKSNMRKDFNRMLEAAGLPHIRFHDLRHTAASLMMNHQVPILVASRRLGHSKPSVTLDIYSHLYQESQNDVAKLLDELVTSVPVEMPKVLAETEPQKFL
ncbi:MAG: hypothetical protein A2X24_05100 [Chloroflexi bacterium GWB2_54_36]|nr:MAG: hypothetical protein A2X24_05100 [Chloroflexi bacterium GWB2_54_36]HBA92102.1 hypothetical protein [Anaerolineaceae bacterium]